MHDELDAPLPGEQTPEDVERERRRRIAMENERAMAGLGDIIPTRMQT